MTGEFQAYALLILVGFLPNEIWRMLGLVIARGIDEESEFFMWARAVAIAVLAGVIAKIILDPPGALASVHVGIRLVRSCAVSPHSSRCAVRCWPASSPARWCSRSARSPTECDGLASP
jgi:hypothetical protein